MHKSYKKELRFLSFIPLNPVRIGARGLCVRTKTHLAIKDLYKGWTKVNEQANSSITTAYTIFYSIIRAFSSRIFINI
jgi:hypothetical protein